MPTPEPLSSAPGAGGTLSVWAMAIVRQCAGESRIPITSREPPWPGTRNGSWPIHRPARLNRCSTSACARRSAADPAARGPACARCTANRCASAADGGAASATVASRPASMRGSLRAAGEREPADALEVLGQWRVGGRAVGLAEGPAGGLQLAAQRALGRSPAELRGLRPGVLVAPQAGDRVEAVERQQPVALAGHQVDGLEHVLER